MSPLLVVALATASPQAPEQRRGPADTAEVGVVDPEERKARRGSPDPDKFSRGFFGEGAIGPVIPIGPTRAVLSTGFGVTGRLGYEIRRFVGVAAQATATMAKYDDGVLRSEILGQYYYTAEARFGIPIRRFLIALQGGAGAYQVTSNLLQVARISDRNRRFGFAWDASIALDVHTRSRHFSGGIVATFFGVPALRNAGALSLGLYLRYTL